MIGENFTSITCNNKSILTYCALKEEEDDEEEEEYDDNDDNDDD